MTTKRFDTIADIGGADDWHDAFGTAISLQFAIAEVLDMSDIEGDVTPAPFDRWAYHRAPCRTVPALETVAARADDFSEGEWADDFSYATVSLASALHSEEITQAQLIHAGDVLSRYIALLDRNGKTY